MVKKLLIIGLGNPILGDDGVGWRVAEEVQKWIGDSAEGIEFECLSLGGLSLMEHMTGYAKVILIDAIYRGNQPVGSVNTFPLVDLPDPMAGHTSSVHDTSLRTALNVGRTMGIKLPDDKDVIVVAIEAQNVLDFSEELSPAVAESIPSAVEIVLDLLKSYKLKY